MLNFLISFHTIESFINKHSVIKLSICLFCYDNYDYYDHNFYNCDSKKSFINKQVE